MRRPQRLRSDMSARILSGFRPKLAESLVEQRHQVGHHRNQLLGIPRGHFVRCFKIQVLRLPVVVRDNGTS